MKKTLIIITLTILVMLTGCVGNEERPKLRLGLMPDVDSIPFIIADKKGYFKDEGVEVELIKFKSAMERDAELQSKHIDGAVSDLLAVFLANEGGLKAKVTSATDGSYNLIMGKKTDGNIVSDITGKDIAVSKNTIIEYVTDKILERNELHNNNIEKIIIPQIPLRLEMLLEGKISGATLPEPFATLAVIRGGKYITGSDELGINPGVVLFSAHYLNNTNNGVDKMYLAYNKAVEYINNTHQDEFIDLIIDDMGFPEEIKNSLKLPKYRYATSPNTKDVEEAMDWLIKKELISKKYQYSDIVYKY